MPPTLPRRRSVSFNLRQVRAGNSISVNRSGAGELREIDYRIDPDRLLKIAPAERRWVYRRSKSDSLKNRSHHG